MSIREGECGEGGVDCMNQNILTYMSNLRTKEWWWQLFRLVVDVAINIIYQIYRQFHLNSGEYRFDALCFHQAIFDA